MTLEDIFSPLVKGIQVFSQYAAFNNRLPAFNIDFERLEDKTAHRKFIKQAIFSKDHIFYGVLSFYRNQLVNPPNISYNQTNLHILQLI
jgi:hypothetical protein